MDQTSLNNQSVCEGKVSCRKKSAGTKTENVNNEM